MKPTLSHEKAMPSLLCRYSRPAVTRRFFLKRLGAAGLAAIPLLTACSASDGSSNDPEARKADRKPPATRPPIPPIDAAAPTYTRTATFAMG